MKLSLKDVKRRIKSASKEMDTQAGLFQEAAKLTDPNRSRFFNETMDGSTGFQQVFDDTAIIARRRSINTLQQSIVPTGLSWATLDPIDSVPDDRMQEEQLFPEFAVEGGEGSGIMTIEEALEMSVKVAFQYINSSNFAGKVNESLRDMMLSTGVLEVDYNIPMDRLEFKAVPLCDVTLGCTPSGDMPRDVFYAMSVPYEQITAVLKVKPTEKMKSSYKESPNALVKFKCGVYHDYDTDEDYYVILCEESGELLKNELLKTGSRFIVFRSDVSPGETLGRGIDLQALPSIRQLNLMIEHKNVSDEIDLIGMYTVVNDGILNTNTLSMEPGALISVMSNSNTDPTMRRLDTGGITQSPLMTIQDLKQQIRDAYMVDPIGSMNDPTKTATEILARQQMALAERAPEVLRIAKELAEQVFWKCLSLLGEAGKIPKWNDQFFSVRFTSPVGQIQQIEEAQALVQAAQMSAASGIDPQMFALGVKVEEAGPYFCRTLGVPATMIRTNQERERIGQQAAQIATTHGASQGAQGAPGGGQQTVQ